MRTIAQILAGLRDRNAQREGAAPPLGAGDFEGRMVSVGDGFAYREPESGAAAGAAIARIVGTVEPLENGGEVLRRDALARVAPGQNGTPRLGRHFHPHAAAGAVVAN